MLLKLATWRLSLLIYGKFWKGDVHLIRKVFIRLLQLILIVSSILGVFMDKAAFIIPMFILAILSGLYFAINIKTHRIKRLYHEWLKIKHLDYIFLTDTTRTKDQRQRELFGHYAEKSYATVWGFLAITSMICVGINLLTTSGDLALNLLTGCYTVAFLGFIFLYFLRATKRFNQHLIASYFFLQVIVSLTLFVLFFIMGVTSDNINFTTFVIIYILTNVLVFVMYINIMPFYQLRKLVNFTSVINGVTTLLLFFGTLFGQTMSTYLIHVLSQPNRADANFWRELLQQSFFPTVRTIVSMISMVFLISGSILQIYFTLKRTRSEAQLETYLLNDDPRMDQTTYDTLKRIVYWGSRSNSITIFTNADLMARIKAYETANHLMDDWAIGPKKSPPT